MQGFMMVDTGVAIMLLTKKWVDLYGLNVKARISEYIYSVNGIAVQIMGMTSMNILLAPTLEVDIANVAIYSGNSY